MITNLRALGTPENVQATSELIANTPLGAVTIRPHASLLTRRRHLVIRTAIFILSFGLAILWGLGWLIFAVVVIIHYLRSRPAEILVGHADGLSVIEIKRNSISLGRTWPAGTPSTLTLRRDEPDVTLEIQGWTALASGLDVILLEEVARSGGSEILRLVDRPRR
jgi:hypothetical protein